MLRNSDSFYWKLLAISYYLLIFSKIYQATKNFHFQAPIEMYQNIHKDTAMRVAFSWARRILWLTVSCIFVIKRFSNLLLSLTNHMSSKNLGLKYFQFLTTYKTKNSGKRTNFL